MNPTLDIIIVNWNSGDLVSDCIKSIKLAHNPEIVISNIIIVDNASADDSFKKIDGNGLPLVKIANDSNLGFAKACNIGANKSKADYLLFLNPDTKLFSYSLDSPILFLEKKENLNIGIVGIKIIDDENKISKNCSRFPTFKSLLYTSVGLDKLFPKIFPGHFMTEWEHDSNSFVDQVMGSFFLIRRKLFTELKGYDERFFVYFEDLDLAQRAKQNGYSSYYFADASLYHQGGGTTVKVKAERLYLYLSSKLKYCRKYFNNFYYIIIFVNTISFEFLSRITFAFFQGRGEFMETLKAYKKLLIQYYIKSK